MDTNTEGRVIKESKVYSGKQKLNTFIILVFIATALVGGYYLWNTMNNQVIPQNNKAVEGELPPDLNAYGYIYLSGFNREVGINAYAMSLDTNTLEEITSSGNNWEFSQFDESHALFATANLENDNQTEIVVADFANETYLQLTTPVDYYNRNIHSFTSSNDSLMYAARTKPSTDAESFFDPQLWHIVIGEPSTQKYETLPESFSPVFISDRNEVIFAKADGIYTYNVLTKVMYPIETGITGFKADTEIAISPDRTKMIVTTPINNSIFIYTLMVEDTITTQSIGGIKIPDRYFLSPVISPDNRFYAVFAYSDTPETAEAHIEIRVFDNKEIVNKIPIDSFDKESVRLNAWSKDLIFDTAKGHGHNSSPKSTSNDH